MRRKKILKFIANLFDRAIVKVLFYLVGIFLIFGLSGKFSGGGSFINTFLEVITSQDMLTLFLAGLLSLGVLKVMNWFEGYMEESMKIEDDHHKIITQYKQHRLGSIYYDESFADKQGVFLLLRHLRKNIMAPQTPAENATKKEQRKHKKILRQRARASVSLNSVKDQQSEKYVTHAQNVENYLSGRLCLCSINVFANVAGDTYVRFEDCAQKHELPSFVITHADEILQAHKNSQKNNSSTIRLNNFRYEKDTNTLVLETSRSTYYHMLITNRCMDYTFANGMSIREIYEYEDEICPLERSKLGNQIGINGLIVTKDNYVLIEKRGRKKITWKNKFAQSISLAMKLKDLNLGRKDVLENDCESAQRKIKYIIEKTINDNFGLRPEDYSAFDMRENFLGLARDLLEGGKPNLYFYVQANHTAAELKKVIENNSRVVRADNIGRPANEKRKVIGSSKLDSAYYLVPFAEIEVDYHYRMFLDRSKSLRVNRKLYPRCKKRVELWDKAKEKIAGIFNKVLVRECGEALLVTLAYMELRNEWKNKKEEQSNG